MGRKTKASKRNTRIQKKIYVNVLIVGAVILLYICINGKFQIEKAARRANDLALAMDARCYHGGEGRTKMKPLKYKKQDVIAYLTVAAYAVVLGVVVKFSVF